VPVGGGGRWGGRGGSGGRGVTDHTTAAGVIGTATPNTTNRNMVIDALIENASGTTVDTPRRAPRGNELKLGHANSTLMRTAPSPGYKG